MNKKQGLVLFFYILFVLGFFILSERVHKDWLLYFMALSSLIYFSRTNHTRELFKETTFLVTLALLTYLAFSNAWSNTFQLSHFYKPFIALLCISSFIIATVNWVCTDNDRFTKFMEILPQLVLGFAVISICYAVKTKGATYLTTPFPGILGLDNRVHGSILVLSMSIPLLFTLLRKDKPLWLIGLVILPFFLYGAISQARMAVLAYLIVFALAILVKRTREASVYGAAAMLLLVLGIMSLDVAPIVEEVMERGSSYRPEIWRAVFDQYFSNCSPWLGCGHGSEYDVRVEGHEFDRAHSIFLAQLYFGGIVGLVLFLCWFAVLLGSGRGRRNGQQIGWIVALAYVVLANFTSGDAILIKSSTMWLYLWLPTAMIIAYRVKERDSVNSRES